MLLKAMTAATTPSRSRVGLEKGSTSIREIARRQTAPVATSGSTRPCSKQLFGVSLPANENMRPALTLPIAVLLEECLSGVIDATAKSTASEPKAAARSGANNETTAESAFEVSNASRSSLEAALERNGLRRTYGEAARDIASASKADASSLKKSWRTECRCRVVISVCFVCARAIAVAVEVVLSVVSQGGVS